jgi:steroid delta-isomerase-like uncharacterized protein
MKNKSVARRYFAEVLNRGNFTVAGELLAPDVVFRNPPVIARGVDEFRAAIEAVRGAFPDLQFVIEDELAEGDRVAMRWRVSGTQRGEFFGRPASGRKIDVTGMNMFRIASGRIQEIWVNMDRLGEAEQLGWIG